MVESGLDRLCNGPARLRSSSFIREKISTLASTAMPIERMKPAMPGRVSVTGMSLNSAKRDGGVNEQGDHREHPGQAGSRGS